MVRQMIGLDGKPIVNEALVRQWVRDEQRKIEAEKQDQCNHARSGTVNSNLQVVTCDDCNKVLDPVEDGNVPSSGAEFKNVGKVL